MKQRMGIAVAAWLLLWLVASAHSDIIMETVTVGDPGNAADANGRGSVSYIYEIGKYEVTAKQYTAFLNAVAKTDPYGLYNPRMLTHPAGCRIERHGVDGDYSYSVAPEHANRPVNYVSVWDAVRFVNWLHNGQGAGDTESGAYFLNGMNAGARRAVRRSPAATWFLPDTNEWYKAAFYKGGGTDSGYWKFPTQSDAISVNMANYDNRIGRPVEVASYGDFPSAYGTFDQGGNVWELTESGLECGGSYRDIEPYLSSSSDGPYDLSPPAHESVMIGFRVAFDPDPAKPPRRDFPRVGDYEVLSCDFHMHTVRSDGRMSTEDRIMEAYEFGFDSISITDHFVPTDMGAGTAIAEALGIILIPGMETGISSTSMEHLVALNVSPSYVPRDEHAWAEEPGLDRVYYRDQMIRIAESGGVLIYAHPHPFNGYEPATQGPREPILWGIEQGIIVGVEVKNWFVADRWGTVESHDTWCYPFAFDWALDHNLAVFANSDVHRNRTYPQAATLVFVTERTSEGVIDAIRRRRTLAWFDGMIWGREAPLSDLIDAVVSVKRADEPGMLVFRNSSPIDLKAAVEGAVKETVDLPAYAETRVVFETVPDKVKIRWNNVWMNPRDNLESIIGISLPGISEAGLLKVETERPST